MVVAHKEATPAVIVHGGVGFGRGNAWGGLPQRQRRLEKPNLAMVVLGGAGSSGVVR